MGEVLVQDWPEKCSSHGRPVVVEVHETGSITSTDDPLGNPYEHRTRPTQTTRGQASRSPQTNIWAKTQEMTIWAYCRAKSTMNDLNTASKPLSKPGMFHRNYVQPQLSRKGKNERVMLGRCQAKVEIQDGRGETQSVIHAASHNYAGCYEQDSASEELHRLCLDTLALRRSAVASALESALHRKIADLFGSDFCCTTGTGYGSNLLAFPAILGKSWLVIFDEKCHNSMFVGAYQSDVSLIRKFKHNNVQQLEAILRKYHERYNILVAVEGVYSMDGTVPPLDRLAQLKKRYNFTFLADEAHSLLSLGSTGKGCVEMWNEDHPDDHLSLNLFDLRTATLSKACGAIGGIVCGTSRFERAILTRRDELLANATEALTPAAMVQSLHVLGQPSRLQRNLCRLRAIVAFVRSELGKAGIYVYGHAMTPILPIHTGRPSVACKLSYVLRLQGVLATPIATPAVPMWGSRVRVCLSADFDDDAVNRLVGHLIKGCQIAGISTKARVKPCKFIYEDNQRYELEGKGSEAANSQQYIQNLIMQDKNTSLDQAKPTANIIHAGHAARSRYGIGSGAARWTTGTFDVHLKVEQEVADLIGTEDTMTFPDSYIGLMSTIAALCRPLIGYKKHYIFIPREAPKAVLDGIKVAPKKSLPTVGYYDNAELLLQSLKAIIDRGVYVTLYLDSGFQTSNNGLHQGLRKLCQVQRSSGMTILLDNYERPEQVLKTDIVKTAQSCGAQLAVYGSFNRTFGLPGAYLAGEKQLINELRYTSRGYMFSTSPLPFVMGMIVEALRGGNTLS